MHTYSFPLPPYARPAFGCRNVLQRLERLFRNPNAQPLDVFEVIGWVYGLRLAKHYVNECATNGQPLSRDFLKVLKSLCIFAPPSFVNDWEKKRIWEGYSVHPEMQKYFNRLLDEGNPSELYCYENSYQEKIWEEWLENCSTQDVLNLLHYSETIWVDWVRTLPQNDGPYYRAAHQLQGLMKFSAEETHIWGLWEEWVAQPKPYFKELADLMGSSSSSWFMAFAGMLQCPIEMIGKFFGLQSVLAEKGLYKSQLVTAGQMVMPWGANSSVDQWITDLWKTLRVKNPSSATLNWEHLITALPNLSEQEQQWPSLTQDNPDWVETFALPMPVSVLIVGGPGSGKNTLTKQLLQEVKKDGYVLRNENKGMPKEAVEITSQSKERLDLAAWLLQDKNAVLIVDDVKLVKEKQFKEFMVHKSISVVVRCDWEQAKSLPTSLLHRFEHVIDLSELSYPTRLRLAENYFQDKILALKVARALKLPSEIARVGTVCQQMGDHSWKQVEKVIATFKKLQPPSADFINILDEDDSVLPPLAQSPAWDNLFEVLGAAFNAPQRCKDLGGQPPKGAILWGPPGTGKTLFARHLAKKFSATCLAVDCSQLKEKVKEMVDIARAYAPCVVLLDEANPIIEGPSPNKDTLAFTSQLDGVKDLEGVMFIATTNKSPRSIHAPLMRSGRLNEVHYVGVPQTPERGRIWEAYLKDKTLDRPLNEVIALLNKVSKGFTGADIKEVVRKVVEKIMLKNNNIFETKELLKACDNLMWDNPNGRDTICAQERWSIALHEAGHALLAWRGGFEVSRVTIRQRGDAAGSVQYNKVEGYYRQSKTDLAQLVQVYLGGIAAEQAILGAYGQGGSSDIAMVRYVLQDAFAFNGLGCAGPLSVPIGAGQDGIWTEMGREEIEWECRYWAKELFEETVQWLNQHQDILKEVASCLIKEFDMCLDDLLPFEQKIKDLQCVAVTPPNWEGREKQKIRFSADETLHGNRDTKQLTIHKDNVQSD